MKGHIMLIISRMASGIAATSRFNRSDKIARKKRCITTQKENKKTNTTKLIHQNWWYNEQFYSKVIFHAWVWHSLTSLLKTDFKHVHHKTEVSGRHNLWPMSPPSPPKKINRLDPCLRVKDIKFLRFSQRWTFRLMSRVWWRQNPDVCWPFQVSLYMEAIQRLEKKSETLWNSYLKTLFAKRKKKKLTTKTKEDKRLV